MTLEHPSIRRLYKILLGLLLKKGNRIRALKILLKFSRRLHLKDKKTLQKVLGISIKKIRPVIELRNVKKGGTTYKIPVLLTIARANIIAAHWIISATRKRSEPTIYGRFSKEMRNIYHGQSALLQKKKEIYQTAVLNRPFVSFRRKFRRGRTLYKLLKKKNRKKKVLSFYSIRARRNISQKKKYITQAHVDISSRIKGFAFSNHVFITAYDRWKKHFRKDYKLSYWNKS